MSEQQLLEKWSLQIHLLNNIVTVLNSSPLLQFMIPMYLVWKNEKKSTLQVVNHAFLLEIFQDQRVSCVWIHMFHVFHDDCLYRSILKFYVSYFQDKCFSTVEADTTVKFWMDVICSTGQHTELTGLKNAQFLISLLKRIIRALCNTCSVYKYASDLRDKNSQTPQDSLFQPHEHS